jgi:hypothetical protein
MALPIAVANLVASRKNQKRLKNEISNRPTYNISDEAYQNQALAKSDAFGRDRSIQMQEQQLDQDAANAAGQAKDVTNSTSGLLSTIAAINSNKESAGRNLAQDEAQLRGQKLNTLMNTNTAMIDEKDKAWNFNENMPHQLRVAALRDKVKYNQEQAAQQFAASSNFMTNMFAGGGFSGGGKK